MFAFSKWSNFMLVAEVEQFSVVHVFQLRLSPSRADKSNTSAKSLLGVTIKNTQTEQNLVSRDT